MSNYDVSTPFSRKALKALEQVLQEHRALIWVDPTTNALSVKRMFECVGEEQQPPLPSSGMTYA